MTTTSRTTDPNILRDREAQAIAAEHDTEDLRALDAAIRLLENAQSWHVTVAAQADELEEAMPDARERALERLIAAGKSPSAAKDALGSDPEYAKLRDRRRTLTRDRMRAEYAVLAAGRRVELALERVRTTRAIADVLALRGPR